MANEQPGQQRDLASYRAMDNEELIKAGREIIIKYKGQRHPNYFQAVRERGEEREKHILAEAGLPENFKRDKPLFGATDWTALPLRDSTERPVEPANPVDDELSAIEKGYAGRDACTETRELEVPYQSKKWFDIGKVVIATAALFGVAYFWDRHIAKANKIEAQNEARYS